MTGTKAKGGGLTKAVIRGVLRRNRGSKLVLAARAGVSRPMISRWLRGRSKSQRVAAEAQLLAAELLQREAAAGEGVAA